MQRLIAEFDKLPGIGPKTASRLVFDLLHRKEDIKSFADALNDAHGQIHLCPQCFNLSDNDLCNICGNPNRDQTVVCVVAHNQDVEAVEKTGQFTGTYHLLNGVINPLDGITPDKLKISELEQRIVDKQVKEIILVLDQSMEGEATAIYLAKLLKKYDITTSQLARGIPMGANIEYTDEITLSSALENRKKI
ncbi:recombination protein RecR [bacterium]|nr:recombination protein RecR [bacterium]MBT4649133.1 recombination protein RecR [bacterium]